MSEKIIINPLTRISGFAEIEVNVENGQISEAKTKGFLFRGLLMPYILPKEYAESVQLLIP